MGTIFTLSKKRCLPSSEVDNCYKYSSLEICEECLYDYDLVENECVLIEDDSNCISKIDGVCKKCAD